MNDTSPCLLRRCGILLVLLILHSRCLCSLGRGDKYVADTTRTSIISIVLALTGCAAAVASSGSMSEFSSTALDFREMMRKERALALKKKSEAASGVVVGNAPSHSRYLSRRRSRLDLERNYRVENGKDSIDGIYYVPDFVTAEEGTRLQAAAQERGGSGEEVGAVEWKDLFRRRLQIHGGTPHPSGMVEEELPAFLSEVCTALVEAGIFPESSPPNHVLLNEYSEGQGIGPHKDGPLYEGRVAILSLGREAFLDFWRSLEDAKADCAEADARAEGAVAATSDESMITRRTEFSAPASGNVDHALRDDLEKRGAIQGIQESPSRRAVASVKCEDCSLVVFEGQAYYDAWHGIAASAGDPAIGRLGESASGNSDGRGNEDGIGLRSNGNENGGGGGNYEGGEFGRRGEDAVSSNAGQTDMKTEDIAVRQQSVLVRGKGKDSQGGRSMPASDVVSDGRRSDYCGGWGAGADASRSVSSADKRLSFTIRRVAKVVPADSVVEHAEARSERERRKKFFERSVTETGISVHAALNASAS